MMNCDTELSQQTENVLPETEGSQYVAYLCDLPEEIKYTIRGKKIFINLKQYKSVDEWVERFLGPDKEEEYVHVIPKRSLHVDSQDKRREGVSTMNGSILRLISGRETMSDPSEFQPAAKFLMGNTEMELANAEKAFDKWFEKMDKTSTPEASNEAYNAIWDYVSATNQFYHENGVRWGIRLMLEVMSGSRTLGEVTRMKL